MSYADRAATQRRGAGQRWLFITFATCVMLAGCSGEALLEADAGARDTGPPDSATRELGTVDVGSGDSGPLDASSGDGGPLDQGLSPTLPTGSVEPLAPELRVAVLAALPAGHAFLLSQAPVDPFANFAGDLLGRRFAVAGFEGARARFDDDTAVASGEAASIMRLLGRSFDFDSPLTPGDLESLSTPNDVLTLHALHCDRVSWPADYGAGLVSAAAAGGYGSTHVVLAWVWAQDHGCALPLSAARWVAVVEQLVALVAPGVASDLAFEAAALLHVIGQGFRVPAALVQATLEAQRADGGWTWAPDDGSDSQWHSTGLALWFLHERLLDAPLDTVSAGAR